jgi:hypothetical protein
MILAIGMLVSGFAQDAAALAVTRVFTGIGIGSAVAGVNVIVAEYASDRRRGSSTTAASIAYFATTFTVYFLLSWTPKMLTQLGFSIAGGHIGVVTDEHSRRRWMCAFRLFRQGSGPAPASCAFSCGALWHDTDVWTCIGGL